MRIGSTGTSHHAGMSSIWHDPDFEPGRQFQAPIVTKNFDDLPVPTEQHELPDGVSDPFAKLDAVYDVAAAQMERGVKGAEFLHGKAAPRVDPAVQNGTVQVDVELDGKLPAGARPDLSVDGTIEIERLADVLYVGRPAFGQPDSEVRLFKVDADGVAARVPVQLGRSSVNLIEIRNGLNVGDRVILSDTSAYDQSDRIRLN